jgi:hypothetical protein
LSRLERDPDRISNGPFGDSELAERLRNVRKRKQSFGGQTVDMEAVKRRLKMAQREKRRQ